ncbi:WD40 repeat-like protein [Setomelanomma holmii]|uniref:WD40 repeat-like protein n=1 Tax=Setomelanomma holmii TaxID=210430 RepID=A0A9P4H9H3_9PLEO|nr:WD40 repeat-like protein [Setomelanomma holmii]
MASLHLPALDEHHHFPAPPLSVPTTYTPALQHDEPTHASCPHSPTIIAAANTLATLADSRPDTTHDDEDDFEDDDYSGGISITSADLLDYTSASSMADAHMTEEDVAEQLQSVVAQFQSFPHTASTAFDPFEPLPSYHMPSIYMPIPHVFSGHSSSSDPSLEPPPTLQEAHLSIQDKGSFAPITSFFHYLTPGKPTVPGLDLIQVPESITRDDLQGDRYDAQGIDWAVRNTTRSYVRAKRYECESAKLPRSLQEYIPPTPNTDNFFRFKRNNTTHRAFFPHFQLRNILTATSRNDICYAAGHRVFRTDAEGSTSDIMIDLSKRLTPDGSITTIASTDDVLIVGAFDGEYAITNLASEFGTPCTFGRTSDYSLDTKSRIVNHMHLSEARTTYQRQAVLCSNDHRLRVLDCVTDTFLHSFLYPAAVNCAATSPNGRMRVVVGDFQETLITNAETGQPFETLNSHTDDAFACAWADDGIHVATAAQDSTIVVWDARYWDRPLTVLTSELSIPRSLRFSPVGSGPRVLIAAEADDYVNVIDARTFDSKQVFDFFGPIGGTAFAPDGQSLFIANGERRFGGIIELDRTGWGENATKRKRFEDEDWHGIMADWAYNDRLSNHDRVPCGDVERERRGVDLGSLVV